MGEVGFQESVGNDAHRPHREKGLFALKKEQKAKGESSAEKFKELLRGMPEPGRCTGLLPAESALQSELKADCAPVLAGRQIEDLEPEEQKKISRCIESAIRLRAALSALATKNEDIEKIRDPDLLF